MDIRTPLDLRGTAEEAFLWTDALIEQVIERVVQASPVPQPQQVRAAILHGAVHQPQASRAVCLNILHRPE